MRDYGDIHLYLLIYLPDHHLTHKTGSKTHTNTNNRLLRRDDCISSESSQLVNIHTVSRESRLLTGTGSEK